MRRAKLRCARPTTDNAFTVSSTDDVWYDFGTQAQDRVNRKLSVTVPDALWTVPTELSSSDGGYTYVFGDDVDSESIFAYGHFKLYDSRESIPDYPLNPGVDFTVESTATDGGTVIRIPGNVPRSFPDGGPWAQYAAPSNVITSTTQPTIPKFARVPMLTDMVRLAHERLGMDTSGDEETFGREWLDCLASIATQAAQKHGRTVRFRGRRFFNSR